MNALKAHVENGRIVVDEPMTLPEGTELYLLPAGKSGDVVLFADDGLENGEREELLSVIDQSLADVEAGQGEELSVVIAELRSRS